MPDVAAADDDRDLHAHGVDFGHFGGDLVGHARVDDFLRALEHFAAQFQDDAFIDGFLGGAALGEAIGHGLTES
jgi:hypothetical protein